MMEVVEGELEVVLRPDKSSSYGRILVSFFPEWRREMRQCSHLDTLGLHKPPCNQRNKVCLEFL